MAAESKEQSTLMTLRGVHARYDLSQRASLLDVSLAVRKGELLCILGPNGSGKTTLVRVLSGALAPFRGTVDAFGAPLGETKRKALARRLGVVGQMEEDAHDFTVRDVVMMGRAPHQDAWLRERDEDRAAVSEMLARCRLTELSPRLYRTLSGGEQKRVQIARALAQRPEVLVLDEPAAFLDVHEQIALYDLLTEEVHANGLACVVVMHDLNVAAQYADRVALFKAGALVAIGAVDEVMTYRTLKETFDADLYCGVNELTKDRFFLPMRVR